MRRSEVVQRWQAARDEARDRAAWKEAREELPCVVNPWPFTMADENGAARVEARKLCGLCPLRSSCLEDALRMEVGQRAGLRMGIRGGLTGLQRARISRARGCGVCGAQLAEESGDGRRGLYCPEHGVRGARQKALAS